MSDLLMQTDGIYDDKTAIILAKRKKKVDYMNYVAEQQQKNCRNRDYVRENLISWNEITKH
jgi:hypothetical protein